MTKVEVRIVRRQTEDVASLSILLGLPQVMIIKAHQSASPET
jgi:hypothetical protein